MNESFKRVLVISPHADDEVIGCGGMMAHVISQGGTAHVIVAALGDTFFPHLSRIVTREERRKECEACAVALGHEIVDVLYDDKELRLDTVPKAELITKLERSIAKVRPTAIFIPYPSIHQDHEAVFKAMLAVLRPSPIHTELSLICQYEDPRIAWSSFVPSGGALYVGLTERAMDIKRNAFLKYETQSKEGAWRVYSPENIRAWSEFRGRECGLRLAEKFYIVRQTINGNSSGE